MGQDSYLPLEKSGQSVIDQNLPYRFLRGQPLKSYSKPEIGTITIFYSPQEKVPYYTLSIPKVAVVERFNSYLLLVEIIRYSFLVLTCMLFRYFIAVKLY